MYRLKLIVFIKELLEAGVFQTMAFKFHTVADRDMLRKRLCFIRDFAAGRTVRKELNNNVGSYEFQG